MTRHGPQKYPGASLRYWYQDNYGGDAMEVNVVVLHTTESRTVPSYGGGGSAPNLTAVPDFGARKLKSYQHFRPERLLPVAARMWEGAVVGRTTGDVAVLGAERLGAQPIASISTSTGTYIANGMLCHNSHGDPGALDFANLIEYAREYAN